MSHRNSTSVSTGAFGSTVTTSVDWDELDNSLTSSSSFPSLSFSSLSSIYSSNNETVISTTSEYGTAETIGSTTSENQISSSIAQSVVQATGLTSESFMASSSESISSSVLSSSSLPISWYSLNMGFNSTYGSDISGFAASTATSTSTLESSSSHSSSSARNWTTRTEVTTTLSSQSTLSSSSSISPSEESTSDLTTFSTATSTEESSTTIYYSQEYYITDSETTFTTFIPTMTVVDATHTPTETEATITTDLAFLQNANLYSASHSDSSSDSKNRGGIIGGVIGGVAGFIIAVVLLWLWHRHNSRKRGEMKGFSHSITSTRRYDEEMFKEKGGSGANSKLSMNGLFSWLKRTHSNTSTHSSVSTNPSSAGLDGLRSSILQEQELQQLNRYAQPYRQLSPQQRERVQGYETMRRIHTVEEDEESPVESPVVYTRKHSQTYKSSRLQNPRLLAQQQENPFEETRRRPPPPPPPSARKTTNTTMSILDHHRSGSASRHSTASQDSSVMSDSGDSDDSLLAENDGNTGTSTQRGFFVEIV